MLSLIFFVLKISAISLAAIYLGNFITIDGRSVSDHVKKIADRSRAAPVTQDIQRWAHQISTAPLNKVESSAAEEEEVADRDRDELKSILHKQSLKSKRR